MKKWQVSNCKCTAVWSCFLLYFVLWWWWWFSHSVVSDSWDPMDCSPPGSSVHGIFQARVLEWIAISFAGDLPNPGIEPRSPALQADSLPTEPRGKSFCCVPVIFSVINMCYFCSHRLKPTYRGSWMPKLTLESPLVQSPPWGNGLNGEKDCA